MHKNPKVLFLSKGSASRSQMAEGLLRALGGDQFIVSSAGCEHAGVSPQAIEVMREVGIDISAQVPREVISVFGETFQCVVSLCDPPRERYPVYPFTRKLLRWSVPDPEAGSGEPEERIEAFRQVREELQHRVEKFIASMEPEGSAMERARAATA